MDDEADLGTLPGPGSSNSRGKHSHGKHSDGRDEGDVGSNGWSRRASPEVKAALPHLSQVEGSGDSKVNGGAKDADARSDGDGSLTLREKVERREAAARAQAMAAAGEKQSETQ